MYIKVYLQVACPNKIPRDVQMQPIREILNHGATGLPSDDGCIKANLEVPCSYNMSYDEQDGMWKQSIGARGQGCESNCVLPWNHVYYYPCITYPFVALFVHLHRVCVGCDN